MEVFCRMCGITVASVIVMLLAISFVTNSVDAQSIPEIIENMSPEEQAAFKKKVEETIEKQKEEKRQEVTENKTRGLLQQEEIQARQERALLQQQQNYSTYEDPILGIRFEYPSWWEISEAKNSIRFDLIGDSKDPMYYNTTKTLDRYTIANVQYFLPSLLTETNTIDRFMRQKMIDLRFPPAIPVPVSETQNISVNKTSTIGVDDIPAYRVELEDVLSDDIRVKSIHYFSIDNSTGVGYMISLNTNTKRLQDDIPLFKKMVESFKFLS